MGRLLVAKAFIAVTHDDVMKLELVRGLTKLKAGNLIGKKRRGQLVLT
jgi:hypothetical protein